MQRGWMTRGMLWVLVGALVVPVSSGFAAEQSAKAATKADAAPSAVTTPSTPKAARYVGSSESKKFHKTGCPYVAKITKENRVEFATIAEAEQAGYERCKVCWPGAKKGVATTSAVKTDAKSSQQAP